MAALGGRDQGGAAKPIGNSSVGAGRDREPQNVEQSLRAGVQKWVIFEIIADVDIRAGRYQRVRPRRWAAPVDFSGRLRAAP
jgi:hypothetical protein